MKTRIIAALCCIITSAAFAADYTELQAAAKDRLMAALKAGKQSDITAAASTMESLSRARYLDNMSRANDVIMPVIEGFAPQLAALPDAIKQGAIGAAKSNPAIPQFAVQLLTQFLAAQNVAAAREAVGDLAPAIKAMEIGEQAARESRAKAPEKQDYTITAAQAEQANKEASERAFRAIKDETQRAVDAVKGAR